MHKRHGTRRWLLCALVVLVAASAALGSGHGASAESKPRPDYGSKAAFKLECELLGGTFTESLGYTYCHHAAGTVQCDANGNNCTSHTAGHQPPGSPNLPDGTGDQNAPDGGGPGFPGTGGGPVQTVPDTLPNLPAND